MEDGRRSRVFARGYSVFNVAQVDGFEAPAPPVLPETKRIRHAEAFCRAWGRVPLRRLGASPEPRPDHAAYVA